MVVDNLYLGEASEEVSSAFSFDSEVIERALRNIYSKEFNAMTDIEQNLFAEFWSKLCEATDIGIAGSNTSYITGDFYHELQHNNAVFAAFKVHRMGNDMARLLIDSNGNLKPFEQWYRDVRPIADHQVYNWGKTEYNTAIKRAHLAVDWIQFEAEADVLPNLEWVESTAVERRITHVPYYGLILPINHELWKHIKPGDEWGCQCDLYATDAEPTPEEQIPPFGNYKPSAGLDNNPAQDSKLFNDSHPYFPSSCSNCKLNKMSKAPMAFAGRKRKDCYECEKATSVVTKSKAKALTALDLKVLNEFEGKRIEVASANLTTGRLRLNHNIVESYLYHTHTNATKRFILELQDRLSELVWNNDFEDLRKEGKTKANYERKRRRGVKGYSTYNITINGIEHIIGMENRGKYEVPYYIAIKKER